LLAKPGRLKQLIADKAYDSRAIRRTVRRLGAKPIIPARKNSPRNRDFRKKIYRERNVIERFFSRLKDQRRLATRFEKLARNFNAMLHLAAVRLSIN
jgi:transposase